MVLMKPLHTRYVALAGNFLDFHKIFDELSIIGFASRFQASTRSAT